MLQDIQQEFRLNQAKAKQEGFARFLEDPMTKVILGMLPPAKDLGIMEDLLYACWQNGFNAGGANTAVEFLSIAFKKGPKADV